MPSTTLQFISQVKLGELRRQRTLLTDAYDALVLAAASKSPVDKLGVLYHGLRDIKCAGKAVHPELPSLEILLTGGSFAAKHASPSDVVSLWIKRLEEELSRGRLRAEIAYLFGGLLGEWGRSGAESQRFLEQRQKANDQILQALTAPSVANNHAPLITGMFAELGSRRQALGEKIREAIDAGRRSVSFGAPVQVKDDIYQTAAIRQEGKRFAADFVLESELASALRMHLPDVIAWDWPKDGVAPRVLWTRNKWRLYFTMDFPSIGLIGGFGEFWRRVFDATFFQTGKLLERKVRLRKLLQLKAPAVILENEERMRSAEEAKIDMDWYEPRDPWDGSSVKDAEIGSLSTLRAIKQGELRRKQGQAYYSGEGYGAAPGVDLVHAEVQSLGLAFPDRPLFIAKLDVQDFFSSIPHDVLITIFNECGVGTDALDSLRRYLRTPYQVGPGTTAAGRGIPMNQPLSHFLADFLMALLERFVHQRSSVRIIRAVDDITLLAPSEAGIVSGWQAVHAFIEACGMRINSGKCGAIAFGAPLPAELPTRPPTWGMLQLREDRSWMVHEPTFQTHLTETRDRFDSTHSILARVTLYNAHLRFVAGALGLALDLGDGHRLAANDGLRRFQHEFFATGSGIVTGLKNEIHRRYLQQQESLDLPESWFYWPITAGGMSLRNAAILVGQYQTAYDARKKNRLLAPKARPEDWQRNEGDWAKFYGDLFQVLKPDGPKDTAAMKALTNDFINRGKEISGGKQATLSDYWRWILCLYGPEIIENFGTFRFLLTDLVPVQLIQEQLLNDSSLDRSEANKVSK